MNKGSGQTMDGDKNNDSTFPVPATMSDVTLLSTPMPQAASTATKRNSPGNFDDSKFWAPSGGLSKDQFEQLLWIGQRHLDPQGPKKNTHISLVNDFDFDSGDASVASSSWNKFITDSNKKGKSPKISNTKVTSLKLTSEPISLYKSKNSNLTSEPESSIISSVSTSSAITSVQKGSKISPVPMKLSMSRNFSSRENLDNTVEKLGKPDISYKFESSKDLMQHRDDRTSFASSMNSSLGVIPSEVLDDAQRQPLLDFNQDMSLMLAQQLNLDSSLLKDGMDISTLASEHYKERLAAKYEDDKENQRSSGRSSSDYWTIHGYSSDNSRNNTAKRLSSLSTGSGGEADVSNKLTSPRTSLRPLSEMNFLSSRKSSSSKSGKFSLGSNPFHNYSKVSVSSEDFQSGEDAMQRLERDERQFSMASTRSLSGIYGDTSASVSVNGEKLSMSSFLRSGSGPLGCLEAGDGDEQPPQFGMPAKSPEKTGKPRAIVPPPQEKSTFVVMEEEEEPVKDTPWAPHSLMEQFSNIHSLDADTSVPNTSVPSLSYISQLLENLPEGANPREMLAQLMASQDKPKKISNKSESINRISSVVEGENSFCQGVDGERSFASRDRFGAQNSNIGAPVNDSSVSSVCNVTDFEGDEEACVCVMTPQSMDFDIFNELSHPVEYSFIKACYMDGQRKDSAAYVHFPVSKLILYPGQRRTLTISIAALIGGEIKIKIEVSRKNPLTKRRECTYVYGKIVAEIPRVSLMTQHRDEMVPMPDCEFNGKYQHTIVIKNEGRSEVPLKLTVTKITNDDVMFYFGEREKKTVTVMIKPGQMIRQMVQCETPPVFADFKSPDTIIPVEARVDFSLPTLDIYQLNPIDPVNLVAHLKPYFFNAPSTLVIPSIFTLFNNCDYPVFFKTVIEFGYTVQPSSFTVPPYETFTISVGTAEMRNPRRYGDLTLHSLVPQGMHTIKLQEHRRSSLSSNNSLATPQGSRATSPTSPTGLGFPVEELKVSCSCNQLVWGSCFLHQKVVKTFCLKNKGRHREKLRLTISDSSMCFKIVNGEDTLQSELKLSLQPMENREIKVAALATSAGPQWGLLTISRISRPADKNVLPLYAFGGKARVNLTESIFEVGGNKFLFLDEKTLQGRFVLSNTGDNSAFFRISQANIKTSWGLSISPKENILPTGQTATIHIALSVTAERLEYLLRQPSPYVCVAQLSICFGDESTRQRLLRMRGLDPGLAARVTPLSCIPAHPIVNLDKLDRFTNGAEGLWHEDTDECMVGVFIKRTALEALRLDTSVNFVDLSTTMSKQH